MILVTIFLLFSNQTELQLVPKQKEKCQSNHILFYLKGNGNIETEKKC